MIHSTSLETAETRRLRQEFLKHVRSRPEAVLKNARKALSCSHGALSKHKMAAGPPPLAEGSAFTGRPPSPSLIDEVKFVVRNSIPAFHSASAKYSHASHNEAAIKTRAVAGGSVTSPPIRFKTSSTQALEAAGVSIPWAGSNTTPKRPSSAAASPANHSSTRREGAKEHEQRKTKDKELEERNAEIRRVQYAQQQRRALELIYEQPKMDSPCNQQLTRDAALKDGKKRPCTASAALQRNDGMQLISGASPTNVQSLERQQHATTDGQSPRDHALHWHKRQPDRAPDSSTVNERVTPERFSHGVSTMRAPTKEEVFNCSRRHMSLDEAAASDKREAALHGTRPLYSFSSNLGLGKEQLQQEKHASVSQQRLQRLGRLSSSMEQERRETKELVVGVEEVSAAIGIEHKPCNLLANNSSDGYVVPWLRHPGHLTLTHSRVAVVALCTPTCLPTISFEAALLVQRNFITCPHACATEGKFTLDDLPHASKNIAHAKLRGEATGSKLLEQVVSHWKGAPPKEDQFKYIYVRPAGLPTYHDPLHLKVILCSHNVFSSNCYGIATPSRDVIAGLSASRLQQIGTGLPHVEPHDSTLPGGFDPLQLHSRMLSTGHVGAERYDADKQVAISHLAWAVAKSCSAPPPKKVHEGDYWTQHAKNFIDVREKEMRPATAVAGKELVHKVAVGIGKEIKTAAFEEDNATALKFIANYGRDLRRRTRQILNPANMQDIQNAAGLGAHFPVYRTDVTEALVPTYTHLPLHLPQQALVNHCRRSSEITKK